MRTASATAILPSGLQAEVVVSDRWLAVRAGDSVTVVTGHRTWLDREQARELGATLMEMTE